MTALSVTISRDEHPEPSSASAGRHQRDGVNLHQELPPTFARRLASSLREGEEPLATLFVPAGEVLEPPAPARALVLTADGVLFMEEGEVTIQDTRWGVRSLLYPYAQITAVGVGAALLTGRFTLHGLGNAPLCEITLSSEDVPRFEAAAQLIGVKIAAAHV